jgi:hypothetical protein
MNLKGSQSTGFSYLPWIAVTTRTRCQHSRSCTLCSRSCTRSRNPRERYMQKTFIPCSECRSSPRARATLRTAQMFKMVALESWRASNRRKDEKLTKHRGAGSAMFLYLDLEGFCHEASAHTRYAQASRSRTNSQRPVLFSSWHPAQTLANN